MEKLQYFFILIVLLIFGSCDPIDLSNVNINITIDTVYIPIKDTTTAETNDFPTSEKDSLFHYNSIEGLDSLRDRVISWLWNSGKPTGEIFLYESDISNDSYNNPNRVQFSNLDKIDKYACAMGGDTTFIYHYVPISKSNKSGIIYQGHSFSWGTNGLAFVLLDLIQEGHDVFYIYMQGNGENTPSTLPTTLHGSLEIRESSTLNPISLFIEPVIRLNNWIESSLPNNEKIIMAGISGGGWATTFSAAIDLRIDASFDLSGSYPMYLRELDAGSEGDYEQGFNSSLKVSDFYKNSCSYFDLYSLASQNRKHTQIVNLNDNCCFRGIGYDGYADVINDRVNIFGGSYQYIEEQGASFHTVSVESRYLISY